jgi:hypothetical protein
MSNQADACTQACSGDRLVESFAAEKGGEIVTNDSLSRDW